MKTTSNDLDNGTNTVATSSPARSFALLLSIFFLIDGVWEMISPVTFGALTGNATHGIIHIVLGIVGLIMASRGRAPGFLNFVGILLLLVAILWFIPGTRGTIEQILNANRNVAILNIILGIVSLIMSSMSRRTTTSSDVSTDAPAPSTSDIRNTPRRSA